jgi:hypothetical protein
MILKAVEMGLGLIDKLIPDPEAKREAKLKLMELEQAGELKTLDAQMQVIVAEAKSEHPLTSQWRPITMLTFTALIVAHWLGFTSDRLPDDQVLELLSIVKVGLGGYVLGRSAEKGIQAWKAPPEKPV